MHVARAHREIVKWLKLWGLRSLVACLAQLVTPATACVITDLTMQMPLA
jgi:hypothetical protein